MNTQSPTDANAAMRARDLAAIWHPCTQMHDHERVPLIPIARGEGAWLIDYNGKRYLDAISSWWTNIFGHANPRIAAAVHDQLDRLEHVIFAGFSHAPAIELAEELVRIAPRAVASPAYAPCASRGELSEEPAPDLIRGIRGATPQEELAPKRPNDCAPLTRVFFADNGSSAVEVALKMSFHYWRNAGQPAKTRFIALTGSYHGETLGALSVTDVPLYRATYAPLLLDPFFVASPDCFTRESGQSWDAHSRAKLADMRLALEQHSHAVCAVIVEPLVQCAGGMRMYHPAYLSGLRQLCDEFNVHLIADEIAVGFGRTGSLFACEQAGITPDFLCLSKGLTGGFMPLSVVLTHTQVYDAFYAEYTSGKAFLHSHSYTGNPLACRAALATLCIFRDEPVLQRNRDLAAHLQRRLAPLSNHPHVAEVRQTGMIAAVELVADKANRIAFAASDRRGLRVYLHALERGVVLRPLGDVVYFMPPYVVTTCEIDLMVDTAISAIEQAVA